MTVQVGLEGKGRKNYRSFCRFYKVEKERYNKKHFESLPLHLREFFEMGSKHFIKKNLNRSSGSKRVGYSERRKAYHILSALELVFQTLIPRISREKACTATFSVSWHDRCPYVVKLGDILEKLFLSRCYQQSKIIFEYEHVPGLSDDYKVSVRRIGAFPLRTLVIQTIYVNKIDTTETVPTLLKWRNEVSLAWGG